MHAMRRRAWELGACSVEQQCMLFDVFVTPVLSYGCELWGPDLLLGTACSSVERVHRWFCRRIKGSPLKRPQRWRWWSWAAGRCTSPGCGS